jgi:hypothetical protein
LRAKQSNPESPGKLDCFVAALLAMTRDTAIDAALNRFIMESKREAAVLEHLKDEVNQDTALTRRGRFLTTTFLIEVGSAQWLVSIVEGKIASVTQGPFVMPSWSFALRASQDEWQKFWSADPRPGSNDLMALVKRRVLKAEGNLQIFMANLRYFKESLEKLRPAGATA